MAELISMIVPVYNVARYLPECLDSILAQTYSDFELLLIDDGSADESGLICDQYAEKDSRIRVIHRPNCGVSAARNLGLDLAAGEYICFADSDDVLSPRFLEILYETIKREKTQVSSCSYVRFQDGEPFREIYGTGKAEVWSRNQAIRELTKTSDNRRGEFMTVVWNKLYAKSVFDGLRFPLDIRYEDEYLAHRLLMRIDSFSKSDDVLYFYRQHGASFMNRNVHSDLRWLQMLGAFRERCELLRGETYRDVYPDVVDNYFETMAFEAVTDGWATGQFWKVYVRYCRELLRYRRWVTGKRYFLFVLNPYWYWRKHVKPFI